VKSDTTKILSNSEAIHRDLTQLATNLDVKLKGLEVLFQGKQEQGGVDEVSRMRDCVQSAATVISTTSVMSIGDLEEADDDDSDNKSELQDWLRMQNSELTLQWVESGDSGSSSPNSLVPKGFADSIDALLNPSTSSNAIDLAPSVTSVSEVTLTTPSTRRKSLFRSKVDLGRSLSTFSLGSRYSKPNGKSTTSLSKSRSGSTQLSLQNIPEPDSGVEEDDKPRARSKGPRSLANLFRTRRKPPQGERETKIKGDKVRESEVGAEIRRKVVFVGDGAAGKTCFLM
jgi:hypothetical protein